MLSAPNTSPSTILPVDVSSLPSTEFQNLPLETLLGLSTDQMTPAQRQHYVTVLRNARQNAPTLVKHIAAGLPKAAKPSSKKSLGLSAADASKLADEYS